MSKQIQLSQDEVQQLKRIFLDPCLPLPKMKRQNQGIYCNSPFQLYLVSLRFIRQNDAFDEYNPFQSIHQIITQNQQSLSILFSIIQQKRYIQPIIYQNVHFVRYTAYEICLQNYQSLKIQGNILHNFIVYLFTLTDVYIRAIFKYIQLIQDPIYKFVQIICRYSVFRSFVMEIQESFGFIFNVYQTLYSDSIRDSVSNKPKFCFWRPAMSKWYLKMNKVHQQTNLIYFMLLTQMRQNNIINILQNDKYPVLKQSQIIIKNKLEMNDFLQNIKENIQRNNINISDKSTYSQIRQISTHPNSSLFIDFLKQNSQLLQLLTCQYVQYMIDLSIDQFQVHWCGHSEQNLDKTYFDFQNQFLQYNQKYNQSLLKCLQQGNITKLNHKLIMKIFNIFVQEDVNLLEEKNVKPVTLNIMISKINKQYFNENPQDPNHNHNNHNHNNTNLIISSNNSISNLEHQLKCNPIFFDFTFKDQNLKYFNQKAKIIRLLSDDDKCYFSIPPLLSVQEIMVKSIDTKNTQNQENIQFNQIQEKIEKHQNSFQYISDAEGEELQETKKYKDGDQNQNQKKAQRKSSLDQINQAKSIVLLKKTQSLQNSQQIDEQNMSESQSLVKQSFLISSNSTKNSSSEFQQQYKVQVQQKSFYSDSIKIQYQADKETIFSQKSQKNISMN